MYYDIFFWISRFRDIGLLGFCFVLFEFFLIQTGESLPFNKVGHCIDSKKEVLYFQEIKNDLMEVKLKSLKKLKPEILVTGSSRVNMYRSEMFEPYTFYNFSNLINNFSRSISLINSLDNSSLPKYLFVLVEPFHFRPNHSNYDTTAINLNKSDINNIKFNNISTISFMLKINKKLFKTPNWKNIGLKAILLNRGLRTLDGSAYWGKQSLNTKNRQIKKFNLSSGQVKRKMTKNIFKNYDTGLSEKVFNEYRHLVEACKRKGIVVIGITPPFSQAIQDVFDSDTIRYRLWNEFQDPSTTQKLNSMGGFYYNFSRFDDTDSYYYEMLDLIHPSEKIVTRMLLEMLKDEKFKKLFSKINVQLLEDRVNSTELPLLDIFSFK